MTNQNGENNHRIDDVKTTAGFIPPLILVNRPIPSP